MENITGIVAVLGTLSLSVERITQMFKNVIPFLFNNHESANKEGWRRTAMQALSISVGAVIAYGAKEQIQSQLASIFATTDDMKWYTFVIFGLLASGGSGLWNHTLAIVEEIKKTKKSIAAAAAKGHTLKSQ